MPADVVVVGSANLDLVVEVNSVPVAGETVFGGDVCRIPGGKGANQAVAAARLGRSVAFVGRIGDDDAATILRAALDDAGVDTDALSSTADAPSGMAMISVAANGDNAIVVSPGANAHLSLGDVANATTAISSAKVVLLQLEVPVDTVAAAARLSEGTVVLNPAPAPSEPLPTALLEHVDILIPNQTELAVLTGHDGIVDMRIAAELAQRLPVRLSVITLGGEGALVVAGGETTHIPAPAITAVDTTAAGDAFCGALADTLVGGTDLVEAARWAVRVGAATTLRAGAQPSLPDPEQVAALLDGR